MGYDIADYKDIDPKYGTMADVDRLLDELKKRNMRLMMDLVVNHTSDQHEWFKQSRSSKDSPHRDWYIWKDAKYDSDGNRVPPNNWSMILGEGNSAWTWDEGSQQYYLALFTPEQPDLNWELPEVRSAVHNVMRFWLDKGVCGFRMDVINHISKDQGFPDADIMVADHPYQPGFKYYCNGPRLHEYIKEINRKVLSHYSTITVGEMPFIKDEKAILKVVGAKEEELRMIFIFDIVDLDDDTYRMTLKPWGPRDLKRIVSKWQKYMIANDGWNSVFIENHDNPRSVSRYTDDSDEWRETGAKLLALMQTTLSGTPYVYQGEEIGMRNIPGTWDIAEYKDVETLNYWKKMQTMYKGNSVRLQEARQVIDRKCRDHARTPVQWSAGPNAGFSDVKPWMRVNDDFKTINAESQRSNTDPNTMSVYQFWKRGIENRKANKEVFVYGGFEALDEDHPQVFAYLRTSKAHGSFFVALNFTRDTVEWQVPEKASLERWVAGNYTAGKPDKPVSGTITLQPWEGLLGQCKA